MKEEIQVHKFKTLEQGREFIKASDGVWTLIHSNISPDDSINYYAENTDSPFMRVWESIVLTKGYKIRGVEKL